MHHVAGDDHVAECDGGDRLDLCWCACREHRDIRVAPALGIDDLDGGLIAHCVQVARTAEVLGRGTEECEECFDIATIVGCREIRDHCFRPLAIL